MNGGWHRAPRGPANCAVTRGVLALLAGSWLAFPAASQPAATLPCAFEPGPSRAVAAVLDGDTVRLDDGIEVRLIGALAPRASDAGSGTDVEWPPAKEAHEALAALVTRDSMIGTGEARTP